MHKYIVSIADRAMKREAETLYDFVGLGHLVQSGELTYEVARDDTIAAFKERGMSGATAKTYVSQGSTLATVFANFDELESFADDECGGSRSLKRIYDAVKGKAAPKAKKPLVEVVLAALPNLSASDLDRVIRAATEQRDSLVVSSKAA